MTLSALPNEANALRARLGLPAEPVLLDIKPEPLTAGERELIAKRLAAMTAAMESLIGATWD